jgi:hypothetical protein
MAHEDGGGHGPRASVTFPVRCEYRGGNAALGTHGKHLWIADGMIGHGELRLTHAIPLAEVESIEVNEQSFGGSDVQITAMPGLPLTKQIGGTAPIQVTEVVVRTADGRQALWLIRDRGAAWTRQRLAPALAAAGIPFYDDLLPRHRPPVS